MEHVMFCREGLAGFCRMVSDLLDVALAARIPRKSLSLALKICGVKA